MKEEEINQARAQLLKEYGEEVVDLAQLLSKSGNVVAGLLAYAEAEERCGEPDGAKALRMLAEHASRIFATMGANLAKDAGLSIKRVTECAKRMDTYADLWVFDALTEQDQSKRKH